MEGFNKMIVVKSGKRKPLAKMIAEFKRKVRDAGIMEELEERRYYTKPSQLRREREKRAKYLKLK